jgi:di/tricarboxylate transporter
MALSWEAWLTLAVLILTIGALTREALPPSSIVLGAVVVLLIAGIIDARQAFSGFSNPAPITVAALYVLARAVERTGALQPIARSVLGEAARPRWSLARLLVPTAAASAFLNNTPIVAMLAPQVTDWADRRGAGPDPLPGTLRVAGAALGATRDVG